MKQRLIELDEKRAKCEEYWKKRNRKSLSQEDIDDSIKMDCEENADQTEEENVTEPELFYSFETFSQLFEIYLTLRNNTYAQFNLKKAD